MPRVRKISVQACIVLAAASSSTADGGGANTATPVMMFGKPIGSDFSGDYLSWLGGAVFDALDENKDGFLDSSEVSENTIKYLDANGDTRLPVGEMTMAKAKALFNALDLNDDGELEVGEVPESLISVIENADGFVENNDGKVDMVEFSNYHSGKVKAQSQSRSLTWAEVLILLVAGGVAVTAVGLLAQSWKANESRAKDTGDFLGNEEYELEYPPEVAEFQALRDAGETNPTTLKRALMKRALATVPMRLYVQAEERNVLRLYQNSMISPTSWANFQSCIEEVKVEMEVIREEADAITEGWAETILQESHWLHQHIQDEKKRVESLKDAAKQRQVADEKSKRAAEMAKVNAAKEEEQKILERERAIKELEREAEREAEKKKGLTQRKTSSGKKK